MEENIYWGKAEMKLLILTADYPGPDGTHERMFVHVRDLYYVQKGYNVTVLNFASKNDYEMDNIRVISLETYENNYKNKKGYFDIAVSHASNIRNHYRFLKNHEDELKKIVFFFHGHEVLYLNKDYPKPYPYVQSNEIRTGIFQDCYDAFKINRWKRYYKKLAPKSYYVFVSNWIKKKFHANTGLSDKDLLEHCCIINNSIGHAFETTSYDINIEKKYDFITIRSNLDGSKYGVDLVIELAKRNPRKKFLLIGRGKFFDYNKKPNNVDWIDHSLNHDEMFKYLNISKCGLLLTREDTQGVMTCELAAYGMPVITSDIEVCHEFFSDMPNVELISNNLNEVDIVSISNKLWENVPYSKNTTYYAENTIKKELALFDRITCK